VKTRTRVAPISQLGSTLRAYYEEKRAFYAVDFPSTYDRELCRVFSTSARYAQRELAWRFIRRRAKLIRALVARWTGESEFTIDQLLHDMIGRSRLLKLRVAGPDERVLSTSPACSPRDRCTSSTAGGSRSRYEPRTPPRARRRLRVLVLLETGRSRPTTWTL
jgi:hypothetical protein